MTKVQITLTDNEADLIAQKAMVLGYDVTKYIKFVVSREAVSVAERIPTSRLSLTSEKNAIKALKEYKAGKAKPLKKIEDL